MSEMISRIKVPLYQNQLDSVQRVIEKGELVNGSDLEKLESKLKELFNRKYAVLTSNGFSAIFLTLKAINKKKIVLPAISTCFSMVNASKSAGYEIEFADVDMESMSLDKVESDTDIVLAPNHFGKIASFNNCNSESFTIEDSCQSFFSSKNRDSQSDVTVLSFYPSKLINGIDGGAILTDSEEIYQRAKELVYYSEQSSFEESSSFNFRLNNINASFALATIEHIDEIEKRLRVIYKELACVLEDRGISFLEMGSEEIASRLILTFSDKSQTDRAFEHFIKSDIEVSREFIYICSNEEKDRYKNSNKLVHNSFSIPFHPMLSDSELLDIKNSIRDL